MIFFFRSLQLEKAGSFGNEAHELLQSHLFVKGIKDTFFFQMSSLCDFGTYSMIWLNKGTKANATAEHDRMQ